MVEVLQMYWFLDDEERTKVIEIAKALTILNNSRPHPKLVAYRENIWLEKREADRRGNIILVEMIYPYL